jgi:hypothetical protein
LSHPVNRTRIIQKIIKHNGKNWGKKKTGGTW